MTWSYRYNKSTALGRALDARLAVFQMTGLTEVWEARWQWKNEWVKAMEADRAAADPRLIEIWKGKPHE